MVKKKIQDEINDQIQAEFQSAYLYLGFSAWFEAQNLEGFSHWMKVQWEEEIEHGMKFYNHLLDRGGDVELKALEAPKVSLKSPADAFQQALEHERYITKRIHKLYDLAREEDDYPLQTLLHWFIDEQVEEEESTDRILQQLKMVEDQPASLLILDRELAQREGEEDEAE